MVVTWGSSLWITNQRLFVVPEVLEVQVIPSKSYIYTFQTIFHPFDVLVVRFQLISDVDSPAHTDSSLVL